MYEPPKCRKCKRVIAFVTTKAGKQMPVDSFSEPILPYVRGSVFYKDTGEQIRGYRVPAGTPGAVRAYAPHFATCTFADELPRKKPDKRRENIRTQVEREREQEAQRQARRDENAAKAAQIREVEEAQTSLWGDYSPSWR